MRLVWRGGLVAIILIAGLLIWVVATTGGTDETTDIPGVEHPIGR